MFKPRQSMRQPQNPVADMEQFYLNQYFAASPQPPAHNQRFPPMDLARLHQLERRVARMEQHLGLPPIEPTR